MRNIIRFLLLGVGLPLLAETIAEYPLTADAAIDVPAGTTTRIEYLSGTAAATLTKTGAGILEIAIFGNTNATVKVAAGTLKSVRPAALSLAGDIYFRADAADATSLEAAPANGTNFITKIKNADGLMSTLEATRSSSSRPYPFLVDAGLNGLPVFDFGSLHCTKQSGSGTAMTLNQPVVINELLYVWKDYEDAKDTVVAGVPTVGPNPINWRYSYRGKGGDGEDFSLYNTSAAFVMENFYLDDQKTTDRTVVPGPGWHLVRAHSTTPTAAKLTDYGFYGFGTSVGASYNYGGFQLAEVIACTNILSEADRTKADCYLKQKWFGGTPIARLNVEPGAMVDTSEAPFKVAQVKASEGANFVGSGLAYRSCLDSRGYLAAEGVFAATDKRQSLTPNLAFTGDAVISVAQGTGLVDRVTSTADTLVKVGPGALEVAFPETSALIVEDGVLRVDPLATPGAYVHVDANRADTMTLSSENGTNLVTVWQDVNFNGRYLTQSTESLAYGSKTRKRYPFLVSDFVNGLAVVDFGTFSDSEHQTGWGAEMDVRPKMSSPYGGDNPGLYNLIAVWGDREEVKDIPLVNGQEFPGPCLVGNGGAWYRGYGGGGASFKIRRQGSAIMGNDNWLNGVFVDYVTWMNSYVPPAGLFLQNTYVAEGTGGVQQIGGNATETTVNNPNAVRGVCGGLRLGELLFFVYPLPTVDRRALDDELGAKWFDRACPRTVRTLSVAPAARATFPYADVTVSNLVASGTVEAKSVVLAEGGRLTLKSGGADDVEMLRTATFTLGGRGVVDFGDVVGEKFLGRRLKVVEASVTGAVGGWYGLNAARTVGVRLQVADDGVYANFKSSGFVVSFR